MNKKELKKLMTEFSNITKEMEKEIAEIKFFRQATQDLTIYKRMLDYRWWD